MLFVDSSRVWIEVDGKALPEYPKQSSVDVREKREARSAYIAVEEGQEFVVCVSLAPPVDVNHKVLLKVDGVLARDYHVVHKYNQRYNIGFDGWLHDRKTTRRFVFAEIDTAEDGTIDWNDDDEQMACIEVEFFSAVVTHYYSEVPSAPGIEPAMAMPVHPDNKATALVGLMVKSGSSARAEHEFSAAQLQITPGAMRRFARFFYRPRSYLLAKDIIGPRSRRRDRMDSLNPDKKSKQGVAAGSPQARAGPAKAVESAEQRRKRVRAEYLAVNPESIVDLDAPPRPRIYVDLETGEETIEEVQRNDDNGAGPVASRTVLQPRNDDENGAGDLEMGNVSPAQGLSGGESLEDAIMIDDSDPRHH